LSCSCSGLSCSVSSLPPCLPFSHPSHPPNLPIHPPNPKSSLTSHPSQSIALPGVPEPKQAARKYHWSRGYPEGQSAFDLTISEKSGLRGASSTQDDVEKLAPEVGVSDLSRPPRCPPEAKGGEGVTGEEVRRQVIQPNPHGALEIRRPLVHGKGVRLSLVSESCWTPALRLGVSVCVEPLVACVDVLCSVVLVCARVCLVGLVSMDVSDGSREARPSGAFFLLFFLCCCGWRAGSGGVVLC
jgi:hypothetical protein